MLLPISMEDLELFPKNNQLILPKSSVAQFLPDEFEQMRNQLAKIWWSRLIISVRGYVANYIEDNDEKLFLTDDAFIIIHRNLVESTVTNAIKQFLIDLEFIVNYPDIITILDDLNNGLSQRNPFMDPKSSNHFIRIYGEPNTATYRVTNAQIIAHITFMHIFSILQQRWKLSAKNRKGIRFQEDPEWQPDDRVVLFQHFFKGNRTWVMTDFDRHIINVWRPKGSVVIFGDRFIKDKQQLGYSLCFYCGMLEQQIGQFSSHRQRPYCSQKCLNAALAEENLSTD
uniref:Zf-CGNR domain-containing protein n=3 Tax=Loa loa TaxID=7209 RepID=A0A1I7W2R7_LOALO